MSGASCIDADEMTLRYGANSGLRNLLVARVAEANRYEDEAAEIAHALSIPVESARRIMAADFRDSRPEAE